MKGAGPAVPAPEGFKEALQARALADGAALTGIAPVAVPGDRDFYYDWIKKGRQGGMMYLADDADLRLDVRAWYPGARSVLVCAYPYWRGEETLPGAPPGPGRSEGRVARYAVVPDYHAVLKGKMRALLDWVRSEVPAADGVWFADTGPILEKHYARLAGLGWTGKNTLSIHPKLGSYNLLGGIALNLELEPDRPTADHCGSCTRCLDACPTKAFPEPYTMDASRCIAYLNIEHRGPFPEDLRPGLGDWIFGCDLCQEVCPFNKAPAGAVLPELATALLPTRAPLRDWLKRAHASWRAMEKTPVERTRKKGWIRNILAAMGNSGDPAFADDVRPYLESPDPTLRHEARAALDRLSR